MPKNLLIAEDSAVMQKAIAITFAKLNYQLTYTQTGLDALAKAKGLKPDALIVDATLAGKNGYEVCQAIKSDPLLASTRVLLLTSAQNAYDESKGASSGVDDHMIKPFETQALIKKIETLLAQPSKDLSQMTQPMMKAPPSPSPASTIALSTPLTMDSFDTPMMDENSFLDLGFTGAAQDDQNLGLSLDHPESFPLLSDTTQPIPKDMKPEDMLPKESTEFAAQDDFWNFSASSESSNVEFKMDTAQVSTPEAEPIAEFEPMSTWLEPAHETAAPAQTKGPTIELSHTEPLLGGEYDDPEQSFSGMALDLEPEQPTVYPSSNDLTKPFPSDAPIGATTPISLSDAQIEAIVTRVFQGVIERIAWEVVPDMAEKIIKEEIQRLLKK